MQNLENNFSFSEENIQNAINAAYYEAVIGKNIKKSHKCCIFLGGQPGSGKSTMIGVIDPSDEYIHVDLDEYRQYHPYYDEICERYQEKSQEYTNQFAYYVKQGMIQKLSGEGYNFIIDGTLRDANGQIETAMDLQKKGYSLQVDVICTKPEISSVRTDLRYEAQMNDYILNDRKLFPRAVGDDYHDMVCNQLPDSLDKLQNSQIAPGKPLFDKITFHHSDHRKPVVTKYGGISAKQYLKAFYDSSFSDKELFDFHDSVNKTISLKQNRNASDLSDFIQKRQLLEKRIAHKSEISKEAPSSPDTTTYTSAYQHTLDEFSDLDLVDDDTADFDYDFELE